MDVRRGFEDTMSHQMEAIGLFTNHVLRTFHAADNSTCFDHAIAEGASAVIQMGRLFYPLSGEWVDVGSAPLMCLPFVLLIFKGCFKKAFHLSPHPFSDSRPTTEFICRYGAQGIAVRWRLLLDALHLTIGADVWG